MNSNAEKLCKKQARDRQKRIKPGECQKYIRLVLDSNILSSYYGQELITELNNVASEIKCDVKTLPIKECIIWERNMGQLALNPNDINVLANEWQKENQVVKILTHVDLLQIIKTDTLPTIAENFQRYFPNIQHIVLFLRPNEPCSLKITSALLELQIIHQLKVLEIRPPTRKLAHIIMQITKAIAEIPFKKRKLDVIDTFKKFLANDKKQCVRVEGTHGFGRLWQQHLNRLPLVTLEIADTIIDKYSCPKKLLEDLENNANAVKEIADLRIKRSGAMTLQTQRRVGDVLANKLFTLYNSKDPATLI